MDTFFWKKTVLKFSLFLLIILVFASQAHAETNAYEVIQPTTFPPPAVVGVGRVLYHKNIQATYNGGLMLLSQNPDGTGNAVVGDTVQLQIRAPGSTLSKVFTYNSHSSNCATHTPLPPTNLAIPPYFTVHGTYNITVRFLDWCGGTKNVSSLYLVNIYGPTPTPTPTIPPGPSPFLDLPWDYSGKNMTFTEAALSMSAFFDHEYPLLSSGVEEDESSDSIITFLNLKRTDESYSSHDGYDFGRLAGTKFDTPVLAAAAGTATYINTCKACGNAIHIDHDNGYQTRYYHLQKDGLVVSSPGEHVEVSAGQIIGKVGASGNVQPPGPEGSHIHFMVVEDKNNDGNFADNIPDGLTDPYGWQPQEPDPWETFAFEHNGIQKTGNKSYYLWKKSIDNTNEVIPKTGGSVAHNKYKITLAPDFYQQNLVFDMVPAPHAEKDENTRSIGTTMIITAKDLLGNIVEKFNNFFTLEIDFSDTDLSPYNSASLAIYSSPDGEIWTREDTVLDMDAKKAMAQLDHLTHFALMAERKDTIAPITTTHFDGAHGEQNWYRSDVTLTLEATDNEGGLGVDYTLYRFPGQDWEKYNNPLIFTQEGTHEIEYYSADMDENIELPQKAIFHIDKQHPELDIYFDENVKDIVFIATDSASIAFAAQIDASDREKHIIAQDLAGNKALLHIQDKEKNQQLIAAHLYAIVYNDTEEIRLPNNKLQINYRLGKNNPDYWENLDQSWKVDDVMLIKLEYIQQKNRTDVLEFTPDGIKNKKEANGLSILHLSTNNGVIQYYYK